MTATATAKSRHPFELFTLILCVAVGVPALVADARPGSINEALPHWAVDVWGAGLAGGAIVALVGIGWSNRVTGLILEQVGLVAVGCATLVYAAGALVTVGVTALVPAGIVAAFGLSCLWRWLQIQRDLNRVRKAVERA